MSTILNTLIIDRTQADIDNDTDRAYNCYLDLNRIEEVCEYLAGLLGVQVQTKVWDMKDFRTESEMKRVRENILRLREVYGAKKTTPSTPAKFTFSSISQANDIEQILKDIGELHEDIVSGKHRLSFRLGTTAFGNRR